MKKLIIYICLIFSFTAFADHTKDSNESNGILKELEDIQKQNEEIDNRLQEKLNSDIVYDVEFTTDNIEEAYGVYDLTTNHLVEEKNYNKRHPLASLTKIMTAIVILDEVKRGNISLDDKIVMNSRFTRIGGSKITSTPGTVYTVEQLLEALIVYSANNAAYILANYISHGSLYEFIFKMNRKAYELGMYDTVYNTPSGLPTNMTGKELDVSTIKDQIILAKYAASIPKIMEIASKSEILINKNNKEVLKYNNRNKILEQDGNIGLKTGYHSKAGYNMIGIYDYLGIKSIIVTFGNKTENDRFDTQLELHKQFNDQIVKIIDKNTFSAKMKVDNKIDDYVDLYIKQNFYFIKDEPITLTIVLNKNSYKEVAKDEQVGILVVEYKGQKLKEIPLYAKTEILRNADKNGVELSIVKKVS